MAIRLDVDTSVLAPGAAAGYRIASWEGIIGQAATGAKPVWVPDVTNHTGYIAAELMTRSELAIPIFDQRDHPFVAGVVNIEMPKPGALSVEQIRWLETFVAPLATRIPTRRPQTFIRSGIGPKERDRLDAELKERLARDLSTRGFHVEPMPPPEAINIANSPIFVVSMPDLAAGAPFVEAIIQAEPFRVSSNVVVVVADGPFPHFEKAHTVIDMRMNYQGGLEQLVDVLSRPASAGGEVENKRAGARLSGSDSEKSSTVVPELFWLGVRHRVETRFLIEARAASNLVEVEVDSRLFFSSASQLEMLANQTQSALVGIARISESPRRRQLVEYGREYFEAIFSREVEELYRQALHRAETSNRPLHVRIHVEVEETFQICWELLYDSKRENFLGLARGLDISHTAIGATDTISGIMDRPLSILGFAAAAPANNAATVAGDIASNELRLRTEHIFNQLPSVQASWVPSATARALNRSVTAPYDVVHIMAAAGFDAQRGEGYLRVQRTEGGPVDRLYDNELRLFFGRFNAPRLVVLIAYGPAEPPARFLFSTTASALIDGGVAAVVATQIPVSENAAIAFCREFYAALTNRSTIEEAVRRGRFHLYQGGFAEWMAPALYLSSTHELSP